MQDTDNGYKKIQDELEKLDKLKLIIYIDDEKEYERINKKNGEKHKIKVDVVAMLMEYGSDAFDVPFPARPFFRSTFDAHYDDISNLMERCIDKIVDGKMTAHKAFETVGKDVVKKVREMILNGTYAALAESTVKAKGSDKPLYDTGALVRSVKYKIE